MTVASTAPSTWRDEDRARYRQNVRQLGGAFCRLETLNMSARQAANGNGFRAVLVTVTEPGGSETSKLVRMQERDEELLSEALDNTLARFESLLGDPNYAREALLALLAGASRSVGAQGQDGSATVSPIKKVQA